MLPVNNAVIRTLDLEVPLSIAVVGVVGWLQHDGFWQVSEVLVAALNYREGFLYLFDDSVCLIHER